MSFVGRSVNSQRVLKGGPGFIGRSSLSQEGPLLEVLAITTLLCAAARPQ